MGPFVFGERKDGENWRAITSACSLGNVMKGRSKDGTKTGAKSTYGKKEGIRQGREEGEKARGNPLQKGEMPKK